MNDAQQVAESPPMPDPPEPAPSPHPPDPAPSPDPSPSPPPPPGAPDPGPSADERPRRLGDPRGDVVWLAGRSGWDDTSLLDA